jgi:hypothetical protein
MLKRIRIALVFAFALAMGSALIATPARAQDQTYYTYVSQWNVPRGQWGAFEKERDQQNSAMQRLVADGTIVAWGSDANYVHTEDGYTHEDFFIATSRAGILKALETLRPPAIGGTYTSVTKHKDLFLHTMAHGGKTVSTTTGYLRVGTWLAKPGEGDAFVEHVKKYILPILDADIADGTVLMYNFDTEDIHTDPQGYYTLAVVYPSAEAMDRAYTRLAASTKDNPAVGEVISDITVSEAHRDYLGKISFYQHK